MGVIDPRQVIGGDMVAVEVVLALPKLPHESRDLNVTKHGLVLSLDGICGT